jgi:hypothetical protein
MLRMRLTTSALLHNLEYSRHGDEFKSMVSLPTEFLHLLHQYLNISTPNSFGNRDSVLRYLATTTDEILNSMQIEF